MNHIIAKDPSDLVTKVNEALAEKQDLFAPLFVSYDGMLVQRMTTTISPYEYRLVNAADLDDMKTQEENLILLGFDYAFSTVLWYGRYLQWMCRWEDSDLNVHKAVESRKIEATGMLFEHAPRADEMKLVEDVREVLHMEPTSNDGYVVKLPYPLGS